MHYLRSSSGYRKWGCTHTEIISYCIGFNQKLIPCLCKTIRLKKRSRIFYHIRYFKLTLIMYISKIKTFWNISGRSFLVDQVNIPIQVISDAASAINPLLGVVVSGALRLAVATIITTKSKCTSQVAFTAV